MILIDYIFKKDIYFLHENNFKFFLLNPSFFIYGIKAEKTSERLDVYFQCFINKRCETTKARPYFLYMYVYKMYICGALSLLLNVNTNLISHE